MMEQQQNGERPSSATSTQSNLSDHSKTFDFSQFKGVSKDHIDHHGEDQNKHNGQILNLSSDVTSNTLPPPIDLSIKSSINSGQVTGQR